MPYRRHNRKWFCFLSHLSFAFSYIQWKTISLNCALSFVLMELIMVFTLGWVVVGCVRMYSVVCVSVYSSSSSSFLFAFFVVQLSRSSAMVVRHHQWQSNWNVVNFNAFLYYLAPPPFRFRSLSIILLPNNILYISQTLPATLPLLLLFFFSFSTLTFKPSINVCCSVYY